MGLHIKKELNANVTEYLDEVVFDLLNFLNIKMDSEKEFETWYSDIEYPHVTFMGNLYDEDQSIWLYGRDFGTEIFLLDSSLMLSKILARLANFHSPS